MLEEKDVVGGACRTEFPFSKAPGLGTSTGTMTRVHGDQRLGCAASSQSTQNSSPAVSQELLADNSGAKHCCHCVTAGAYLLGVMPPELIQTLGIQLPIKRRDPHYFLPTTDKR